MQASDFMVKNIFYINGESSVSEAAKIMKERDIGCLPVESRNRLVGMLTDRDIVIRVLSEDKDPAKTLVNEAMSIGVHYCYEDEDVADVCKKLAKYSIRRIPVLNSAKWLVGVISTVDLAVTALDDFEFHKTMFCINSHHSVEINS